MQSPLKIRLNIGMETRITYEINLDRNFTDFTSCDKQYQEYKTYSTFSLKIL